MGASISTMIGLVIAIITLRYLYIEKKEKIEYDTKKAFYDGAFWTNEGLVDGKAEVFFDLLIDNDVPLHSFSGKIDDHESNCEADVAYFHFESINKKTITLDVYKMSENQMYTEGRELIRSLGKAKVEYITPDLFRLTFISNCMPHLPRQTTIFTWPNASIETI